MGLGDWNGGPEEDRLREREGETDREKRLWFEIYRVGLGWWTRTVHHVNDLSVGK